MKESCQRLKSDCPPRRCRCIARLKLRAMDSNHMLRLVLPSCSVVDLFAWLMSQKCASTHHKLTTWVDSSGGLVRHLTLPHSSQRTAARFSGVSFRLVKMFRLCASLDVSICFPPTLFRKRFLPRR